MTFYTGKVAVIIALASRPHSIVDFGNGEAGLYIARMSNSFGTPLAARGPRAELESFVKEHA